MKYWNNFSDGNDNYQTLEDTLKLMKINKLSKSDYKETLRQMLQEDSESPLSTIKMRKILKKMKVKMKD
jgi:hypothetical protein